MSEKIGKILYTQEDILKRAKEIADEISVNRLLIYVGTGCPSFADDYAEMTAECSSSFQTVPFYDM